MQLDLILILSALVATTEAVTCALAPTVNGDPGFNFNRESNGVWVAKYTGGYAQFAPGGLSNTGVLKFVNEARERKIFCVTETPKGEWTCFWINGREACETNINIRTSLMSVGNA
ncbi:hypothetical protein Cob_v002628 [Colletotrichum orbiculare MAFF 240422]|uniref:Uncharacterized protein n=1 Tax=Colletotrichum orbiculare (strain 104-T / ATCC 96160 / CBS 514.97 / LARS 414 / MAFF 240422) TaxID=1213857 RepID=N4VAT8_COLOR|nr:hypothetical protein Cob_v002628 [Colletotrichum orbiculare MAFF 240422]